MIGSGFISYLYYYMLLVKMIIDIYSLVGNDGMLLGEVIFMGDSGKMYVLMIKLFMIII